MNLQRGEIEETLYRGTLRGYRSVFFAPGPSSILGTAYPLGVTGGSPSGAKHDLIALVVPSTTELKQYHILGPVH